MAEVVERGLDNLRDNGGDLNAQVALANQIITTIQAETKEADFDTLSVAERAEQLLALFDRQNSIWALDEKAQVVRPETSLSQSSLFTGAVHEPQMYTELKKEIVSCNRIDMLVSFIKWSGLEWNTKITKKDLPETIDKVAATFEFYWNDKEFEYYDGGQRERLAHALQAEKYYDSNNPEMYTMDIRPYSYQQEILDKLEAERTVRGYIRNLVVAATGTGKTVRQHRIIRQEQILRKFGF